MDSILCMEIGIADTSFYAIDKSHYERWVIEGKLDNLHSHAILQRLISIKDNDDNTVISTSQKVANTIDALKNPWEVNNLMDGLYYYQKLILPTRGHESEANEILWYDSTNTIKYYDRDTGETRTFTLWKDFDDIYDLARKEYPDNCFFFDDYSFSIYSLVECYILTERERINNFLKNNCQGNCDKSLELDYKSDILLAAINVLNDLMEKGDFFEAQRIKNGLNTCNGLCKEYNKTIKGCGCGRT